MATHRPAHRRTGPAERHRSGRGYGTLRSVQRRRGSQNERRRGGGRPRRPPRTRKRVPRSRAGERHLLPCTGHGGDEAVRTRNLRPHVRRAQPPMRAQPARAHRSKQEFQPDVRHTHHHAENARDCMREITMVLENRPATQAEFAERVDEINAWITNTLHNISMQVQTRIMDST